MSIDNQKDYWDSVAQKKIFTHPINTNLLLQYIDKGAVIVDYGCGYGRIVQELLETGFANTTGYDTSLELINRGRNNDLPLHHIGDPSALLLDDNSVDCFILFAVLTCIPSNAGQLGLIDLLQSKLKPGGYIYISDYYLQDNEISKNRYAYLNNDPDNFGVFSLPEGVTFRHHTKEWISTLVKNFSIQNEDMIEVKTMNGNSAEAFQVLVQKQLR
ncbi:MAG: class I SAM-dependent methyltransferase [Ferruginibacter sp.]|nr:class I SAM-dependent methyltransferase [Ferruginibacter sp.]